MVRAYALAAVLFVSSAAVAEAAATPSVVAQYSTQRQDEPSGNTRTRTRGTGRLIGAAVVGVLVVGGFVIRKMRGE
jgi:hypothetical protein